VAALKCGLAALLSLAAVNLGYLEDTPHPELWFEMSPGLAELPHWLETS
jgi:hypothetical protein